MENIKQNREIDIFDVMILLAEVENKLMFPLHMECLVFF